MNIALNIDLIIRGPHPWLDWFALQDDAPAVIQPLRRGQHSISCTSDQWSEALAWCAAGPSWPVGDEPPVYIVHGRGGDDFATDHLRALDPRALQAAHALVSWAERGLGRPPQNGGRRAFHGPQEWAISHKDYVVDDLLLVVEHDRPNILQEPGDLQGLETMVDLQHAPYEEVEQALRALGLYLRPLSYTASAVCVIESRAAPDDGDGDDGLACPPRPLNEEIPACVARLGLDELRQIVREIRAVLWGVTANDLQDDYTILDPDREFEVEDLDALAGVLRDHGLAPQPLELP